MSNVISRDFSITFNHGSIAAKLSLESDDVKRFEYTLDDIFREVSKTVCRRLIPRLNHLFQRGDRLSGLVPVENKTVALDDIETSVLGVAVKLSLSIKFDQEFADAEDNKVLDTIPVHFAVGMVAPDVISESIRGITQSVNEGEVSAMPSTPSIFGGIFDGGGLPPDLAEVLAGGPPTRHL
ncbi:hypothetical protein A3F64_03045 [Candidatus Saccharibacteria bacterium RIFCSPHIGHO2_12_FULL_42_8]|nr:MAG: hypothetical protein A3F64_03045 [Candidatus Saccharibacteria bacterium RIFCSPHIGHO2_12_FULL_42_8]